MYVERNIHGRIGNGLNLGAFGPNFLLLISALCADKGEGGAWPVFTGSTGSSGPVPCPGIAVWFPSRCVGTRPLNELTFGPLPPLRCGPILPARSSPRSPAKPEAGPMEMPRTANP